MAHGRTACSSDIDRSVPELANQEASNPLKWFEKKTDTVTVNQPRNTFSPEQNARHTSKFSGRYRHYHDRLRVAESAGNI